MTAKVLRGTEVAEAMENRLFSEVECLKDLGITPTLAIVRVGERSDDIFFEKRVTQCATRVGVAVRHIILDENATQRELILTIRSLNDDQIVHGILLCRPLPDHFDEDIIRNTVDPLKDVDGITDESLAKMFVGSESGYVPCTAQACIEMLDYFNYDLKGKNIVVIGRSLIVGRPTAMLLLGKNATVTITHSLTENLTDFVRGADIVISCVGSAGMLGRDYFSAGQTVIDVGTNFIDAETLVGDVNFEEARQVVEAITPVPGGMGTVTTAALVKHVVQAVKKLHGDMEIFQDDGGVCNVRFRKKVS